MEVAFRSMLAMVDRAVDVIGAWFRGGAGDFQALEPATWSTAFWALLGAFVALVLLALLRRRVRRPMEVRQPEILVTRGEVLPDPPPGRSDAATLIMTISNLSRYPVQVLEVALRTGSERRFGVAEVSALVPAMGEVDVETRLPLGRLEDGVLDVLVYAPATRVKTYQHRAELIWEPWAKRFKVAPLEQRITPARGLPSTRREAVRLPEDLEPPDGIWVEASAPVAAPASPAPSPAAERPERQPPGPAALFAMLEDVPRARQGEGSAPPAPRADAPKAPPPLVGPERSRRGERAPQATPPAPPVQKPPPPAAEPVVAPAADAVRELLVDDREVATIEHDPPPRDGQEARRRRLVARSDARTAAATEAAAVVAPVKAVASAKAVGPAPAVAPPESVVPAEADDEAAVPRRERSRGPLEFPEEF
jgi:hypothetical protein